jgi:hypothetical protein
MTTQQPQQEYQITKLVNEFSRIMKMKLHENMHKGSWETCTYDYLRSRVDEEIKEFDLAISEGRYIDAMVEAGDVGNFFAMINSNIDSGRFKDYTRSNPAHSAAPKQKDVVCMFAEKEKRHTQCNKEDYCEHQIYFNHQDESYCELAELQSQHDTTIRNQTLDDAIKKLRKEEYHSPFIDVDHSSAIRILESLRTPTQEQSK